MKKLLIGLGCLIATGCSPAYAGWANMYADHYASNGNAVLGAEGGLGSAYGFAEHNLDKDETFVKLTNHSELTHGVSLYGQAQYFHSASFTDRTAIVGLGYTGFTNAMGSFTPWVGTGISNSSVLSEPVNLLGWTSNLNVMEHTTVNNWTEINPEKESVKGAVGITHDFNDSFYGNVQYTYDYNDSYSDEFIFRVGYKL